MTALEEFTAELAASRALTSFYEGELEMVDQVFEARGAISTQFVLTPHGWRMSSMASDDER